MEFIVMEDKQFQEIRDDIRAIKNAMANEGKMASQKKWLTSHGAAEYLNVKIRTIYSYISKGILNPKKIGGKLLIAREELESL